MKNNPPLVFSESYNTLSNSETRLLEKTLKEVDKFILKSREISKVSYATRDAHSLSLGYISGEFNPSKFITVKEIFPNENYPVLVRFSHAPLKISQLESKKIPAYGLALKIDIGENEANFPLVNFPVFVTNSVTTFLRLFSNLNRFYTSSLLAKPFVALRLLSSGVSILFDSLKGNVFSEARKWLRTYSHFIGARSYHSIGVYRLGNQMIKLKLTPKTYDPHFSNSDNEKSAIENYLQKKTLIYDIFYQVATDKNKQPINILTKIWKDAPYDPLGELKLTTFLHERDLEQEKIAFNPFDNPEELQPVGKIQHLRKSTYEHSIRKRNELNKNNTPEN